jgi:hypothetical protein
MHGVSYNLVLIIVPLLFWAGTQWRKILAWAIGAWRTWRTREEPPSPNYGLEPDSEPEPLVTSPAAPSGEGPSRAAEGGSEEGAGKRPGPIVETRDGKVVGAWIRVERRDDTDA